MTDILSLVSELQRPRLLIRAARAGLCDYNRTRDLKRLMRVQAAPSPDRAMTALLAEEQDLEETRRKGDASYSLVRHIDILIAMMAEVRLLPRRSEA
ncbi:MAG: hypothetical protein IT551_09130 [Novosphingobium sp.]|mgnify:CR=1 FL=1|jgi:hypothetical protein|nr:hypothetical protein [Novosphingobium sp.]